MKHDGYEVVQDPVYGYRRLEPIPNDREITEFYEKQYYELVRQGGRAPEIRRMMAGGEEAERERRWLHETLYADVVHVLRQHRDMKRVLDIGCGTGDLLAYLEEHGFLGTGIEPSDEAMGMAAARGLTVHKVTLEGFVEEFRAHSNERFDAAILINVLEHVPSPADMLELAKEILRPKGLIGIRVPNDFNALQFAALAQLGKDPWWVAVPDHINYFNFESLNAVLDRVGFEVVHAQGDFPMELFLLMGDNYVGNPELGAACHWRRVRFEQSIPGALRRSIYQALGRVGIGRDCLVFGRLRTGS